MYLLKLDSLTSVRVGASNHLCVHKTPHESQRYMSSLNDFDSGNERCCFQMLDLLEPTTTTDSPTKGQRDRIKNCVGQVQLLIEVIRSCSADQAPVSII